MTIEYVKARKDGKLYSPNWRGEKRVMRQNAVYEAWLLGNEAADGPAYWQINRFPPGRRHEEFERGLALGLLEVRNGDR